MAQQTPKPGGKNVDEDPVNHMAPKTLSEMRSLADRIYSEIKVAKEDTDAVNERLEENVKRRIQITRELEQIRALNEQKKDVLQSLQSKIEKCNSSAESAKSEYNLLKARKAHLKIQLTACAEAEDSDQIGLLVKRTQELFTKQKQKWHQIENVKHCLKKEKLESTLIKKIKGMREKLNNNNEFCQNANFIIKSNNSSPMNGAIVKLAITSLKNENYDCQFKTAIANLSSAKEKLGNINEKQDKDYKENVKLFNLPKENGDHFLPEQSPDVRLAQEHLSVTPALKNSRQPHQDVSITPSSVLPSPNSLVTPEKRVKTTNMFLQNDSNNSFRKDIQNRHYPKETNEEEHRKSTSKVDEHCTERNKFVDEARTSPLVTFAEPLCEVNRYASSNTSNVSSQASVTPSQSISQRPSQDFIDESKDRAKQPSSPNLLTKEYIPREFNESNVCVSQNSSEVSFMSMSSHLDNTQCRDAIRNLRRIATSHEESQAILNHSQASKDSQLSGEGEFMGMFSKNSSPISKKTDSQEKQNNMWHSQTKAIFPPPATEKTKNKSSERQFSKESEQNNMGFNFSFNFNGDDNQESAGSPFALFGNNDSSNVDTTKNLLHVRSGQTDSTSGTSKSAGSSGANAFLTMFANPSDDDENDANEGAFLKMFNF